MTREIDARETRFGRYLEDFQEWIKNASQQAALAAKEGGFLGIGATRVSEREQEMLATLGEIFGVSAG